MSKSIKKAYLALIAGLDVILLSYFVLVFLLQIPYFQTKTAQYATQYLSKEVDAKIELSALHISFFNRLVIDDLYIEDQKRDTMLFVRQVDLGFDVQKIIQMKLKIESICLSDPFFHLEKHEDSSLNFQFLINYFSSTDTLPTKINLGLEHFEIKNGKFDFWDKTYTEKLPNGFSPRNVNVRDLNLYVNDLNIDSNEIQSPFIKVSLKEKNFAINNLTSSVFINDQNIVLNEFNLESPNSDIHADISLKSQNWSSYKDFLHQVEFQTKFLPSDLGMSDLSYFIPDIKGLKDIPHFSGSFSGSVSDLKGKNVEISMANHSHAELDFQLRGLPNFEETYIHLNIKQLTSSKLGMEKIKIPPFDGDNYINLPDNFARLGRMNFSGKITGFPRNMVVNGKLLTSIGSIQTDLELKIGNEFYYSGNIAANQFDAGKFFDSEKILGKVSLSANIIGKGLDKKTIDAKFDGVIQNMYFNRYDYHNVKLAGEFKKETFRGNIKVNDKYVKLAFIGSIDLSGKEKELNFMSEIEDLYPRIVLGVDHVDSSAHLSTSMIMDIGYTNIDSLYGNMQLINTYYRDKKDSIHSQSFVFSSKREGEIKNHSIQSDMFDFDLKGKYDMLDGFQTFKSVMKQYFPNAVNETSEISKDFTFYAKIKDYRLIEKMVSPGLFIDSNTILKGAYRSEDHYLDIESEIFGFQLDKFQIDTAKIHVYSELQKLNLDLSIHQYSFGENTQKRFINLHSIAHENKVKTSLQSYGSGAFSSDLHVENYVFDENTYSFKFDNSFLKVKDESWALNDSNYVLYDSSSWNFSQLGIYHDDQSIELNGKLSKNAKDRVRLSLSNFEMSTLNPFIENAKLSLNGNLNGEASVKDVFGQVLFESNLDFKDLVFNEKELGSGNIKSVWDEVNKELEVEGDISVKSLDRIIISGKYNTKDNVSPLQFDLKLNDLPLTVLEPLTQNILSDFQGSGSGIFQLRGKVDSPELSGLFYMTDASATVDYTNVRYTFRNNLFDGNMVPVKFTKDGIYIPSFKVVDQYNNSGKASLSFVHNQFKDFITDLSVSPNKLFILNTNSKQNELYYGKAFVSGNVNIYSNKGFTKIKANIKTEENTVFNLPLDETSDVSENQFIVFEESDEQKKEKEKIPKEEKDEINVELELKLETQPDALVRLVFDEIEGDVVEARGSGNLDINYDPINSLTMFGEYDINSGSYVFKLQTVVNKKFDIEPGSWIKWNGDPYKGEMNVVTAYKTRARLYDILPEIESDVNYRRKIPVHLRLKMTQLVEAPVIGFEVFLPDARESVKQQLRTELSDETCLNQQVFSLLILTSFSPCQSKEASQANTNVGKATAYEAMGNQLSNWLSNINDNVDIGLTYTPEIEGESYTPEQVEVAASFNLLNDRVILDGNVSSGNRSPTATANNSDVAGEVTIEYLIRPDGKLSVKAFQKVNDRYYIENDNLYIQGVGIKWSKDFGGPSPKAIERKEEKIEEVEIEE